MSIPDDPYTVEEMLHYGIINAVEYIEKKFVLVILFVWVVYKYMCVRLDLTFSQCLHLMNNEISSV